MAVAQPWQVLRRWGHLRQVNSCSVQTVIRAGNGFREFVLQMSLKF